MPHRVWGIALVVVLVGSACVERRELAHEPPPGSAPTTATSTVPPSTPTTTDAPCPAPIGGAAGALPEVERATLDARVDDPRFAGNDVSISVHVDGLGEVAARDPDHRLLPASNQKLLTAMGALEVLGADHRFVTTVGATARPDEGVVAGDLVLVAGGDPTLRRRGSHALAALARQVRASGVTDVLGSLLVDESRFDDRRDADGWLDWQRPTYAGALSALVVDANQHRGDPAFLADPAVADTELFREELRSAGVQVVGGVGHGSAREVVAELARLDSPPVGALVEGCSSTATTWWPSRW